jgi:hypothetical protein
MTKVQQVQGSIVALASLLAVALAVPAAAQVVDQDTAVLAAPATASWDETSGYGAVESGRASLAPSTDIGVTSQVPSDVRWAPAAASWDDSSGYGAVESNRAAIAPGESTSLDGTRVSRSSDMGSLQEEYLAAKEMSDAAMPSGTASK